MQITRRLEIDAGHRLRRHEGKCRHPHGHRYAVELTVSAPGLDVVGRVVDFGKIKEVAGGWLDERWDHGMILQVGDPLVAALKALGCKVYEMDDPPTAEHLAAHLFAHLEAALGGACGVVLERVRIYETPNCWADFP